MKKHFISEPMDFHYKEGNAVDFAKTFDLTGNDNDQMLRVYLKKAGLSDNIESLTPEQRKAFIYDIVKSNKNPGYWKPSVLPSTSPSPTVRSAHVRAEPSTPDSLASIDDIPPASLTFDFKHFSQLSASHSKSNGEQTPEHSQLYERQFQNQHSVAPKIYNVPPTPPSPSTLTTRKGLRIDISGPTNFVHVSGDMTRDMTKNAFDLSGHFDDKCLKKYMIERGITEEDVAGMDQKELIRRIIQSRYTWMPIRKQYTGSCIPPPPSETYMAPSPPPPPRHKHHSKGGALIVQPPTLPSNESLYMEVLPPEPTEAPALRRPKNPPPVAPTISAKNSHSHMAPPPPPPPPPSPPSSQSQVLEVKASTGPPTIPNESKGVNPGKVSSVPPPPPPMPAAEAPPPPPPPPMPKMNSGSGGCPPPPPMPNMNGSGGVPPPPPPPFLAAHPTTAKVESSNKPAETGSDNRGALLESIRAGVALKKVNKGSESRPIGGTIKLPSASQSKTPNGQTEAPQRPIKTEQPDFMSELRNATLKRIKKLENNPYADASSESHC